jgi:hypothetical protein
LLNGYCSLVAAQVFVIPALAPHQLHEAIGGRGEGDEVIARLQAENRRLEARCLLEGSFLGRARFGEPAHVGFAEIERILVVRSRDLEAVGALRTLQVGID